MIDWLINIEVGMTIRVIIPILSLVFVPIAWFVYWNNQFNHRFLYRVGMLCVIAGFLTDGMRPFQILSANSEWWALKNFGLYFIMASITVDILKSKPSK